MYQLGIQIILQLKIAMYVLLWTVYINHKELAVCKDSEHSGYIGIFSAHHLTVHVHAVDVALVHVVVQQLVIYVSAWRLQQWLEILV